MKKVVFFRSSIRIASFGWLKLILAGLIIVLGFSACRSTHHAVKYGGPPADYKPTEKTD